MGIRTYGPNAVDWEERVDVDRLRTQRLARLKEALDRSELGALLSFDFHNIRYMTSTHIGTWAMDKLIRFALLPRGGEPVVWDFGSAARHHQLYSPWLDGRTDDPEQGRARAGISTPASPTGSRPRSGASSTSTGWPASRSGSTWSRCRCSRPWRRPG
jgi:Xaa-Pro dipeptidase